MDGVTKDSMDDSMADLQARRAWRRRMGDQLAEALTDQNAQTAACGRHDSIAQRLATPGDDIRGLPRGCGQLRAVSRAAARWSPGQLAN
jgi:hypothetical protein